MRPIYTIAIGATLVAAALGIACSSSGPDDVAGADESNLTAAELAIAKKSGARLTAAWTGTEPGPLAMVINTFSTFGSANRVTFSLERDTKHVPKDAEDKSEADRAFVQGQILKADSETNGTLEVTRFDFRDSSSFRIVETYRYEVKGSESSETLTMTQTGETETEDVFGGGDAGPPPVVVKEKPVRPPFTLKRAASWCAMTPDNGSPMFDCQGQFGTIWKPTDTPAMCQGKEQNCMRCEAHACKMVKVSSCEADGKFCFESVAACQFQSGQRAGQATTINADGQPLSCEGSRLADRPICCDNIFFGRGEGELD
jgi:hypothetical protein